MPDLTDAEREEYRADVIAALRSIAAHIEERDGRAPTWDELMALSYADVAAIVTEVEAGLAVEVATVAVLDEALESMPRDFRHGETFGEYEERGGTIPPAVREALLLVEPPEEATA